MFFRFFVFSFRGFLARSLTACRRRASRRCFASDASERRHATRREKNEGGGVVSFRDGRTFITTASERRRASSRVFVFVVIFVVVVVVEADRQTDRSVAGRQAGRQGNRKIKQGNERRGARARAASGAETTRSRRRRRRASPRDRRRRRRRRASRSKRARDVSWRKLGVWRLRVRRIPSKPRFGACPRSTGRRSRAPT